MNASKPNLAVVSGTRAGVAESPIAAELPKPLKPLSKAELSVWKYVTKALLDYGLVHRTDAMILHVIVSTFVRWIDAEAFVEKFAEDHDGSYIVSTANGYQQPHQMFYTAQKLKRELVQYLPEACLTIPSFQKVKQGIQDPNQGRLFDPLVAFVADKPKLVHSQ